MDGYLFGLPNPTSNIQLLCNRFNSSWLKQMHLTCFLVDFILTVIKKFSWIFMYRMSKSNICHRVRVPPSVVTVGLCSILIHS